MEKMTLPAERRSLTGKAVRRLRNDGMVPVIVYGGAMEGSLPLQVNERELARVLNMAGRVNLIDLDVAGDRIYPVLTREVQRHPTRLNVTHVDFLAVRLDQMIQAEVRVVLTGEAPVTDSLGVLTQVTQRVTVEALPSELPQQVEVDISEMAEIGQQLTVADLQVGDNIKLITPEDTMLVIVAPPVRAPVDETEETEPSILDEAAEFEEGEAEEGEGEDEAEA